MIQSHVRLISRVSTTAAATIRPQTDARHTPTQFCLYVLSLPVFYACGPATDGPLVVGRTGVAAIMHYYC